ncbi:LAQU0S01e15038g1_1 [Lachancea quebecensis]|uniref:LAQU0S01e15038g1_1 n=1 Tax=Lachancea quebecensis TaxID=1654605 RepID=A0A0P1KQ61_9SACH|nr:LAQU0S01e15038g1_1 [Lachancea quebecensis]
MSAPTMRTTLLLTEHLGYPPISLIDDIINAVNELMYKCTQAMEKYLLERSSMEGKDYTDEIKIGIAKLETLWENSVDRSFDKLELYILRNVLHIPQELIENGSFRLRHHDSLVLEDKDSKKALDVKLKTKMQLLQESIETHKELRRQKAALQKTLSRVKKFKLLVSSFLQGQDFDNKEIAAILGSLSPVNESVKFLASQMHSLYLESNDQCSSERLKSIISRRKELHVDLSSRTDYLAQSTKVALEQLLGNRSNEEGQEVADDSETTGRSPSTDHAIAITSPDWDAMANVT